MDVVGFVYVLRCRDGSYYVGSARGDWNALERRVNEHNAGTYGGYTSSRRPLELVFNQEFQRITDAIAAERQIKGWSRAKKEALIRGDWAAVSQLARNHTQHPR
ncbi:MAG TPA: GIY-YIG nuclease family protein [Candidatus Acidoferrum sp.]|nr:GIY-YIG nuclease family protein [Candidatus Acidoferrum sp.]